MFLVVEFEYHVPHERRQHGIGNYLGLSIAVPSWVCHGLLVVDANLRP